MACSADEVKRRLDPTIYRVDSTVPFSSLPTVPFGSADAIPDQLRIVAERYAAEGLDVFWVDLSPPGSPCRAVKVISPQMEVETVTYHRVGPRNLRRLTDRGYGFVGYGAPVAGALPVPMADGSKAWLHPARADALLGPLYGLYREPDIHAIPLSKLR